MLSLLTDLADLAAEKFTDLSVGVCWTGILSAGVGSHLGVGTALAVNPTMLLVGVVVGAIVVPCLRQLKNNRNHNHAAQYRNRRLA